MKGSKSPDDDDGAGCTSSMTVTASCQPNFGLPFGAAVPMCAAMSVVTINSMDQLREQLAVFGGGLRPWSFLGVIDALGFQQGVEMPEPCQVHGIAAMKHAI